jgi:hypothetical protein
MTYIPSTAHTLGCIAMYADAHLSDKDMGPAANCVVSSRLRGAARQKQDVSCGAPATGPGTTCALRRDGDAAIRGFRSALSVSYALVCLSVLTVLRAVGKWSRCNTTPLGEQNVNWRMDRSKSNQHAIALPSLAFLTCTRRRGRAPDRGKYLRNP